MTFASVRSRIGAALAVALTLTAPVGTLTAQAGAAIKPSTPLPIPDMSATNAIKSPSPDPRVGLKPGEFTAPHSITAKAAETIWNMKMVSHTDPSATGLATHCRTFNR